MVGEMTIRAVSSIDMENLAPHVPFISNHAQPEQIGTYFRMSRCQSLRATTIIYAIHRH